MKEADIDDAHAIAHPDHARVGHDELEARGAEVVHAQVDGRDARAQIIDAGPHRGAPGRVGERAQHAAVKRGAKGIAHQLVAKRNLEARVPLLERDQLDAEHAVERDPRLHELLERGEVDHWVSAGSRGTGCRPSAAGRRERR